MISGNREDRCTCTSRGSYRHLCSTAPVRLGQCPPPTGPASRFCSTLRTYSNGENDEGFGFRFRLECVAGSSARRTATAAASTASLW